MINYVLDIPINIQVYGGVDSAIAATFLNGELIGSTLIIGEIELVDNDEVVYKAYFYEIPHTESNKMISNNQILIDALITHILDYVFLEK